MESLNQLSHQIQDPNVEIPTDFIDSLSIHEGRNDIGLFSLYPVSVILRRSAKLVHDLRYCIEIGNCVENELISILLVVDRRSKFYGNAIICFADEEVEPQFRYESFTSFIEYLAGFIDDEDSIECLTWDIGERI